MTDETAPVGPFSISLYRNIWIANIASQFGALIQGVGAAWMMVQLGGTATQVALVQASVTLPVMILSLLSGAIADNYARRSVMLVAQIYMFAASALLCLFAWMGWLSPWGLLAFTFLIGCGTALNAPSWQATVGDIVPRKTIAAAVAMNSLGFNIARTAGPAAGGAIVAIAGVATAFAVNVFSYLGIILVLLTWRPEKPERPSLREDLGSAMASGVRYVLLSPSIRLVLVRAAFFGIAASAVPSLMPLVAQHLLGGGAVSFGILSGAFGAGAVLGALANTRLRRRLTSEHLIRCTMAAMIAGAVIIALSPWMALTIAGLLIYGASWLLTMATMNVTVQLSAPRWVAGRALSLFQMAAFGAMAAGSWLSGSLAEHFGVTNSLLVMSSLLLLNLVVGFVLRLPEVEDLNLDLIGRWKAPDVKLPVEPRSGPVHVALHFRILEKDVPRFLAAMNQRRRIHLRDGARDWSIVRDLSDPDLWIEQYSFARWQDYVLHNERRTHADTASVDVVRSLHQGNWPPFIQRMLERPVSSAALGSALSFDTTNDPTKTP